MLAVDETGDVKTGPFDEVQRQYWGTAGRMENCQIAVCHATATATAAGQAAVDVRLC